MNFDADQHISDIVVFLKEIYSAPRPQEAVIAVSGGIDSAVSLTLLVKALGPERVRPIFLPYGDQDMSDAQSVVEFNGVDDERCLSFDIKPMVDQFAEGLNLDIEVEFSGAGGDLRKGNIMARSRMIVLYDQAKRFRSLVCGTENKSEKYLGYFTRFGDEASDIEPIQHLYKTQIRKLAEALQIPKQILEKEPSADLWQGQTDQQELGFDYDEADLVLELLIDKGVGSADEISEATGLSLDKVQAVMDRVQGQDFKHQVPYVVE